MMDQGEYIDTDFELAIEIKKSMASYDSEEELFITKKPYYGISKLLLVNRKKKPSSEGEILSALPSPPKKAKLTSSDIATLNEDGTNIDQSLLNISCSSELSDVSESSQTKEVYSVYGLELCSKSDIKYSNISRKELNDKLNPAQVNAQSSPKKRINIISNEIINSASGNNEIDQSSVLNENHINQPSTSEQEQAPKSLPNEDSLDQPSTSKHGTLPACEDDNQPSDSIQTESSQSSFDEQEETNSIEKSNENSQRDKEFNDEANDNNNKVRNHIEPAITIEKLTVPDKISCTITISPNKSAKSRINSQNSVQNKYDVDKIPRSKKKFPQDLTPRKQLTLHETLQRTPVNSGHAVKKTLFSQSPKKNKDDNKTETPFSTLKKKRNDAMSSQQSPRKFIKRNISLRTEESLEKEDSAIDDHILENILYIKQWVFSRNSFLSLFDRAEIDLLKSIMDSSDEIKLICFRLFTRLNKWYSLRDLCKRLKISCGAEKFKEIYKTLTEKNIVEHDYSKEENKTLLEYLPGDEVKDLFRNKLKLTGSCTKHNMIDKIIDYSTKQRTLTGYDGKIILYELIKRKLGECVKLQSKVRNVLFKLHFLYSFTRSDLKIPGDLYYLLTKIKMKTTYIPKVELDNVSVFSNLTNFNEYIEAYLSLKSIEEDKSKVTCIIICNNIYVKFKEFMLNESQIKLDKEKPLYLRRFTPGSLYCYILTTGAKSLSKDYYDSVCKWLKYMLTQNVYCQHKRGFWYNQLAMIKQSHMKNIEKATEIIVEGLKDDTISDVFRHDLIKRGQNINQCDNKALFDQLQLLLEPDVEDFPSKQIQARVVHTESKGKKTYIKDTSDGREYNSVEDTALDFYIESGNWTNGIHCEGRLLSALFHLLFWDLIYENKIPNTYITEIQDHPLDLYSKEFYTNRKANIKKRLQDIREWTKEELCAFIIKNLNENKLFRLFSDSDYIHERNLKEILKCIDKKVLVAMLMRFIKDCKLYRAGLPDLFLWNVTTIQCCFVEVKSDKDKLSTKQVLWLDYLRSKGALIEVCEVNSIGAKSTKKSYCKSNL